MTTAATGPDGERQGVQPSPSAPVESLVTALKNATLAEKEQAPGTSHDSDADEDHDDDDDDEAGGGDDGGGLGVGKKKKKKKPKKKKKLVVDFAENGGGVPPEGPRAAPETEAEASRWAPLLQRGARTYSLDAWSILHERARTRLELLRTPSCARFELRTKRLRLRQVEVGDTTAIRRIKMEPIVQRTQLYGSPSLSDIKDSFQNRYVRSSIPRAGTSRDGGGRDEYVFAITAKDPASFQVGPPGQIKISNRITNAAGYLGNFALRLESKSDTLGPKRGQIYTHPTTAQCAAAGLEGKMFYEIHPQLWGQGIVSEAFIEVLRFAIEEVGCSTVSADPTRGNEASVRLCTKNGLRFTRESTENSFGKPQLFHAITRGEWWARSRPGQRPRDPWGGKVTCRWCLDFRLATPAVSCAHCDWAKYCSRECQRADWVSEGGHQDECGRDL